MSDSEAGVLRICHAARRRVISSARATAGLGGPVLGLGGPVPKAGGGQRCSGGSGAAPLTKPSKLPARDLRSSCVSSSSRVKPKLDAPVQSEPTHRPRHAPAAAQPSDAARSHSRRRGHARRRRERSTSKMTMAAAGTSPGAAGGGAVPARRRSTSVASPRGCGCARKRADRERTAS
eukprot:scaffold6764_cov115-Isochrysis_galbana.AAC.3